MSSIYVVCAGSSAVNGVYDAIVGGYENQSNNNYKIRLTGSIWEIYSLAPFQPEETATVYYTLTGVYPEPPYSTTGWVAVNGSSTPAPKTYDYGNVSNYVYQPPASLNQATITITGAGTAEINGSYSYSNSILVHYSTGTSFSVAGYTNGSYIITPYYEAGSAGGAWAIRSIPSFTLFYESELTADMPPIGYFSENIFIDSTIPCATLNTNSLCAGGDTGGTTGGSETTPFLTGKYVYTEDNIHYIRLANNQPYVR